MYVELPSGNLYYQKTGSGKTNLLVFHGFSQDHTAFNDSIPNLLEHYTIYTFDLFFHGNSFWHDPYIPIDLTLWKAFLDQFCDQEGIIEFSTLGYSIGGRFAIASLYCFPEKTKALHLVAPDGVTISIWYRLATQTRFFRAIFKTFMKNPTPLLRIGFFLERFSLMHKNLLKFVTLQLGVSETRNRIYNVWTTYRTLVVPMPTLRKIIVNHQIPVYILMGKFDQVIPIKRVKPLAVLDQTQIELAEAGHLQIIKPIYLVPWLKSAHQQTAPIV